MSEGIFLGDGIWERGTGFGIGGWDWGSGLGGWDLGSPHSLLPFPAPIT